MTWLDEVVAHTRLRVESLKELGRDYWDRRLASAPDVPPWSETILSVPAIRLIAEIKPASPSHGPFRDDLPPEMRASKYEKAGAAAISVLTEPLFFHSHMDRLRRVAETVSVPVLCKDFTLHPVQVIQARVAGASAVLLIHRLLSPERRRRILDLAQALGMEVLYEVFDEHEAKEALDLGAAWIGINQRDLRTLAVDGERARRVRDAVKAPYPVRWVVESGLSTPADIHAHAREGFRVFLVGTALMRTDRPETWIRQALNPAST